jgi:SAM-dependent methyltransferase
MAESFGVRAERYDRTRPPYPEALVDRVVELLPGSDVVDVGCGTGIVARQFRAAGCRVLGVEPDARMADFARGTGVDVEVATFEAWDPRGRAFDGVVAGTAWHWVDPVAGAAKAAEVLRPGGLLAPMHHLFQPPREVTAALAAAYRRAAPDSPLDLTRVMAAPSPVDAFQPLFDRMADGIRAGGEFGEPEQWRFDWERTYTKQEWLDQLPTLGGLTRLGPDALETLLEAVAAAVDAIGGSVRMRYTTVAVVAVRTSSDVS